MDTTALRCTAVRKRYRPVGPWVLDGVDLVAEPGTLTEIVGGNGSGKSTLLRIAAGVSPASAGHVDRPASVGYVPERLPARSPLNTTQYLAHLGRIRGLPPESIRARTAELVDRFGLRPGPDAPLTTLSKGNRQKVALAQALLAPVGLLVLDEPHSGLDPHTRQALDDALTDARARGAVVLVAAHHPHTLAADASHRITGGRLHPAEPGRIGASPVQVLLRATGPAASVSDLAARHGARLVGHDPPHARLAVPADHLDALLLAALPHGWSLVHAHPDHGGPQ